MREREREREKPGVQKFRPVFKKNYIFNKVETSDRGDFWG
jgi:hypothetical protein